MISEVYNMDCMEYMKSIPDKFFELSVVDPPYGIGEDWKKRNKGSSFKETTYKNDSIPSQEYFNQLFRISKDVIIWGYNYFTNILGSTNYLIIWDKVSNNNTVFKYSKAEIAFTTKRIPVNLVSIPWDGYRMGKETGQKKIHPHQKPIELYAWLFDNYANPGDKIFDSHLGSGSSRIAAYKMGFDFYGTEIDKDYFDAMERRFKEACFGEIETSKRILKQMELFE